jgi:hypothetical protein
VLLLLFSLLTLAGCGTGGGGGQKTTSAQISVIPSTISFGDVAIGETNTQTVTISNSGSSSLTLSQANISGNGFSITGLTVPVTIASGQRTNFDVAFTPESASGSSGTLSLVSNASDSPAVIPVSGSGAHSVTLSWAASTSTVIGYNVYRGSQSGGPYTKLNASPAAGTTFTDDTVQAGQTYYYVTTSVDSSNVESGFSNQVSATIPGS